MHITELQEVWLNQRGGRIESDVIENPQGDKYVLMSTPSGDEEVYLPVRGKVPLYEQASVV